MLLSLAVLSWTAAAQTLACMGYVKTSTVIIVVPVMRGGLEPTVKPTLMNVHQTLACMETAVMALHRTNVCVTLDTEGQGVKKTLTTAKAICVQMGPPV